MKKILSIFAVVSLLAVLVLPAVSLAVDLPQTIPDKCTIDNTTVLAMPGCEASCLATNTACGTCCMLNSIYTVTNWIFYILTLLAVLFIIYGGFTYLTSSGDPTKSAKGKGILTYAIIGLAVALLAKLVPSLVRFILGV